MVVPSKLSTRVSGDHAKSSREKLRNQILLGLPAKECDAILKNALYPNVRNRVLPPDWHQMPTPFRGVGLPNSIFIVDDNSDIRAGIRRQLELSGFEVCGEAGGGIDALDRLSRVRPDLIILDMSMPRMNGVDAARELKHICPNVPVILYTAFADVFCRKQVLPEGVSYVVAKGENLLDRVIQSLQKV
jgi:two-component system, chemotaxis family, chemotaxis protein CheY